MVSSKVRSRKGQYKWQQMQGQCRSWGPDLDDWRTELAECDAAVRGVLNDIGLPRRLHIGYFSFSRHLWRLQNKYTGGTLAIEAEISVREYTSQGLERATLEAIRARVFGIEAPAQR